MGGVRARFGQELRARWPAMVGFALLIGVLGGIVIATTAGARRTATAYDRFLDHADAADIVLGTPAPGSGPYRRLLAGLRDDPAIRDFATTGVPGLTFEGRLPFTTPYAALDDVYAHDVERPNILEGRLPRPGAADEIFVNPQARDAYDLQVGQETTWSVVTEQALYTVGVREALAQGEHRRMRVVGIGVTPADVVPVSPFDSFPSAILSPAYATAHPEDLYSYGFAFIRLQEGAGTDDFDAFLGRVLPQVGDGTTNIPVLRTEDRQRAVDRAIRPQGQALLAFSVLLGLVTVAVAGQLLLRHLAAETADRRKLWALGFTRRELLVIALLRVAVVLAAAAVVAVAVAVALSSRFPIGPARLAEPHPGTAVNLAVIGGGTVALVVLFGAVSVVGIWRTLPRLGTSVDGVGAHAPVNPSRVGAALAAAGAPNSCTIGVRMAFERGRGSTAVPAVGAIVSAVLAVAALTTAFTFSENLARVVDTPALYGWTWDAMVGDGFVAVPKHQARGLFDRPEVTGYAGANVGRVEISTGGADARAETVPAAGIDPIEGQVYPRLVEGVPATGEGQIVLGTTVADDLGVGLGDQVDVTVVGQAESAPATVTGLTVLPGMGSGIFAVTDLGDGAVVPAAVLADPTTGGPYTYYLVDLADGADQAAVDDELAAGYEELNRNCVQPGCLVADSKPPGIRNYDRMRSTPLALAIVLALLAVVTLAVNLATSVRRRRRDFAVLRSVGWVRRQVAATCAWQATTVALVALAVGLPVGIAIGRQLWAVLTEQGGSRVGASIPWLAVALAVPATIVLANLIVFVPGRRAARVQAARVLRSE